MKKTNNNTINAMLTNRGFTKATISAPLFDVQTVQTWHVVLNNLLDACYAVNVTRHNSVSDADTDNVYTCLKAVYQAIGKVDGEKLRCDDNMVQILIAGSMTNKNITTQEYKDLLARKNSIKKDLATPNGAIQEWLDGKNAELASVESLIAEELKKYGTKQKELRRTTPTTWYKFVEDTIADMVEERMMMTLDEVKAEEELRKEQRKESAKRRRAAKKAAEEAVKAALTAAE